MNSSFADWTSEPVITTMDSIAAPIHDIQFPTVTVCEDGNKNPDRLALLERIFNYVKFQCPMNDYYGDVSYSCKDTEKLM